MQYNVSYFIDKFSKIPESLWTIGANGWTGAQGKYCAGGFCGQTSGENTEESLALTKLFLKLPCFKNREGISNEEVIYYINDGIKKQDYPQPTPKARILAALHDIKNMQAPNVKEHPKDTKTIIKYVRVDAEIRETGTEVLENSLIN